MISYRKCRWANSVETLKLSEEEAEAAAWVRAYRTKGEETEHVHSSSLSVYICGHHSRHVSLSLQANNTAYLKKQIQCTAIRSCACACSTSPASLRIRHPNFFTLQPTHHHHHHQAPTTKVAGMKLLSHWNSLKKPRETFVSLKHTILSLPLFRNLPFPPLSGEEREE